MAEMAPTDVALMLAGETWRGWTDVRIRRSIEAVSGGFDLSLTAKADRGSAVSLKVATGDPCKISIDGKVVLTGAIDDTNASYDDRSHAMQVCGRDAAGDLVDCSAIHAQSGEWHGATLLTIAQDLARPFKVPVKAAVNVGAPFDSFRLQEGESAWETLERACRMRQVLALSDGRGGVIITRPSQAPSTGITLIGGLPPVERVSSRNSWRERYSHVIVKAQAPLDDETEIADAVMRSGMARDRAITRYRPLIVLAEDNAAEGGLTLEGRAAFEVNTRAGRSRQIDLRCTGWYDPLGVLWQPLTTLRFRDDLTGVDADLLISTVEYSKSEDAGSVSTLTLTGLHAFDIMPEAPKKKARDDDEGDDIW